MDNLTWTLFFHLEFARELPVLVLWSWTSGCSGTVLDGKHSLVLVDKCLVAVDTSAVVEYLP